MSGPVAIQRILVASTSPTSVYQVASSRLASRLTRKMPWLSVWVGTKRAGGSPALLLRMARNVLKRTLVHEPMT